MSRIQPYTPGSSRKNTTAMESLIESAMISQYVSAKRNSNCICNTIIPSTSTTSRAASKTAVPAFLQNQRALKAIDDDHIWQESVPGAYPLYDSKKSQRTNNESKNYVYIDTRQPTQIACCPHCARKNITTHTNTKATKTTWAAVALSAVVFWPLAWVPLVSGLFKQTNHYCQHCAVKVGRVKPLGCSSSCSDS